MQHQSSAPQSSNAVLVPGRDCGDCTVCCVALRIDDAELQKPAGVACRFLGHGCTIHETRPTTCRHWFCGWRLQPELNDDWRPDRSGILLMPQTEATAGYTVHGYTLQLATMGPLSSPEVLNKLCGFIAGRTPLYLARTGQATKVLANPLLAPLIAAGDGRAILAALAALMRDLEVKS